MSNRQFSHGGNEMRTLAERAPRAFHEAEVLRDAKANGYHAASCARVPRDGRDKSGRGALESRNPLDVWVRTLLNRAELQQISGHRRWMIKTRI